MNPISNYLSDAPNIWQSNTVNTNPFYKGYALRVFIFYEK